MAELSKGTGDFSQSNKIGQGGFGLVYRCKLRDGRTVAIKRAKKDRFEKRLSVEFKTELDMLSQVDHLNLVKLIGYLEAEHEHILVMEYVPNGNLREHLDGTLPTYIPTSIQIWSHFHKFSFCFCSPYILHSKAPVYISPKC